MKRFVEASFAALVAATWIGDQAVAQQAENNFARDRNVGVRDRPKPEYDAVGIRLGSFMLYPELQIGEEYNNNIFATDTLEESDTITHVDARIDLKSLWSNHQLNLSLASPSSFYSEFTDLNTTDVIGEINGRLDVYHDFSISGDVRYGKLTEPLSSAPSALPLSEPVQYTLDDESLSFAKVFNRLRVSGSGEHLGYNYDNATSIFGTPVLQDDRDHDVTSFGLRADYAISPATSLFISATANQRNYRLHPPTVPVERDSKGYEALFGANFDLTHLIRGEIGVGYLRQRYDDPNVGETSGLAVRTHIDWFPDQLVTVGLGLSREVRDAGAVGAASYIANDASLSVDYEFRRNVVLGLRGDYSMDDYRGIDRTDHRSDQVFTIDYAMNRGASLFFEAGHYQQTSDGADFGREYDMDRAVLGIRLRR